LSQLDPGLLKNILFPICGLKKPQVRQLASEIGLERVSKKLSSVGICFIGKRNFANFIDQYIPEKVGNLLDIESGLVVGEHKGIHHYTVGQKFNLLRKHYLNTKLNTSSTQTF
jgi:tRNA U34 2-thiouridine synthase MnmA/TrmU